MFADFPEGLFLESCEPDGEVGFGNHTGGYGFAVGVGIVAWYGRDAAMLSPDDFMLVTASIIGGNSGGVVVNTRGEAVSLVSYGYGIYTQTVPIDRAQAVAAEIERRAVR